MLIELINVIPDDGLTKKDKIGYNTSLRFSRKAIEKGKQNGGGPLRSKNDQKSRHRNDTILSEVYFSTPTYFLSLLPHLF